MTSSYVTRLMRLNFLAPDIVEAIFTGRQPAELSANKLMKDTRYPLGWREQRIALRLCAGLNPSSPNYLFKLALSLRTGTLKTR